MTVRELIAVLKNFPEGAEVVIDSGEPEVYYGIHDIKGESRYKYGEVKKVIIE